MSHNATGYEEDMNPDMIDGLHDPRATWSQNNSKLALRAEAIVRHLDPGRIVYHHASGTWGRCTVATSIPTSPRSRNYRTGSSTGQPGYQTVVHMRVRSAFHLDWAMYRGWYKGERTFGNARVPWELCMASGTRSFLATELSRSARWRRRTCAGRLDKFVSASVGFVGIILMTWDRRGSRIDIR